MRNFITVKDIGNLKEAVAEALEIKADRYKYCELGKNKTLMMVFFNSSQDMPRCVGTDTFSLKRIWTLIF